MITYTKWPDYFEKFGLKEPREGNYIPTTFTWGCEEKDFWEMLNNYPKRSKAGLAKVRPSLLVSQPPLQMTSPF